MNRKSVNSNPIFEVVYVSRSLRTANERETQTTKLPEGRVGDAAAATLGDEAAAAQITL